MQHCWILSLDFFFKRIHSKIHIHSTNIYQMPTKYKAFFCVVSEDINIYKMQIWLNSKTTSCEMTIVKQITKAWMLNSPREMLSEWQKWNTREFQTFNLASELPSDLLNPWVLPSSRHLRWEGPFVLKVPEWKFLGFAGMPQPCLTQDTW